MTHHERDNDRRVGPGTILETVADLGGADEQRREILLEQAESRGLDRLIAEQAYDIAREEKLLPAYALSLTLHHISIQPFDSPRPRVETSEPNEPEWVDAPPNPEQADLERRLRQTFRRLRSHLEEATDPRSAVQALLQEHDVESHP
jgi:hypothetical protein